MAYDFVRLQSAVAGEQIGRSVALTTEIRYKRPGVDTDWVTDTFDTTVPATHIQVRGDAVYCTTWILAEREREYATGVIGRRCIVSIPVVGGVFD